MAAGENTTTNETQSISCFNPTALKIEQSFAYSLIFVVSLTGNLCIGIIVYKTKSMRKPINFLILNMAMSDLLYPIFLFPERLTELYAGSWLISGPLGQAFCKLSYFLPDVSLAVSIQSLVLIAVDRFGAVVFFLRSPLISSKMCPFFVLATWIVAVAIFSPYLFVVKLVEDPGRLVCEPQWDEVFGQSSSLENYFLAIAVIYLFTPLMFLVILYTIIYVKLKLQTIPGEQSANSRQQRVKRERNVLFMSIAIVLGFAVCCLPNGIRMIFIFFVPDLLSPCGFQYFGFVAVFMSWVNCALNPCICFIFSGNYRRAAKNFFRRFRASKLKSQDSSKNTKNVNSMKFI